MKDKEIKEIIKYWKITSEHDYKTMLSLFKSKRYPDSLFYGHIVLEKILKGLVVKKTKEQAPYIHDLVRLQEIAGLKLSKERIGLLNKINEFNIRARYPEQKLKFYKLCTKKYTKDYLDVIIDLYKELCQKLKQKK